MGNALAGALGSAISNVATYPLSLVVARSQAQQGKKETDSEEKDEDDKEPEEQIGIVDAVRKVFAEEGARGLYAGLSQDTAKTVADSFLFFLAYTFFRQRRIRARFGATTKKNVVLPILDELVVGILAGAFGKLFTTPLANIVTRRQLSTPKKSQGSSTRDIAAQIRAEKGMSGFWAGYPATLILTLNPSITFLLNEVLKYAVLPREKRSKPSPFATFILAAISKSAASSVTYPFSLAKTRAQASGKSEESNARVDNSQNTDPDEVSFTPGIISTVLTIARTEGVSGLYAGLSGEVLKGFFSHGFTMLAKDAVYASVVKSYYLFLIVLRKYPSPDEIIEQARKQVEEYAEAASEGVKDVAEKAKAGTEEVLDSHSGNVAVDMTSNAENAANATKHGVESSSGFKVPPEAAYPDSNETAELVGDYVEDEAAEWKSLYHWFWEKQKKGQ